MIIVDSCMIWIHFDGIMQLKKSYHIATNVCSRKRATTFGDLPDYSSCIRKRPGVDNMPVLLLYTGSFFHSSLQISYEFSDLVGYGWVITSHKNTRCDKLSMPLFHINHVRKISPSWHRGCEHSHLWSLRWIHLIDLPIYILPFRDSAFNLHSVNLNG